MIYDVLMLVIDSAITVWFFRKLSNEEVSPFRRWISVILLILVAPLYIRSSAFGNIIIRYLFRWIPVTLYLKCAHNTPVILSLYHSAIFATSLSILQSVHPLFTYALTDSVLMQKLLSGLTEFNGVAIVGAFYPFKKIKDVTNMQAVMIVTVTALTLYSKSTTGKLTRGTISLSPEIVLYPIIVLLLGLVVIAAFDRYRIMAAERQRQEAIELSRTYQFENLKAQLSAQDDIHRLNHDMKNHLIALKAMSTSSQQSYIDKLLEETEGTQTFFGSGNETLDGILRAKALSAKEKNIAFSVNVDITDSVELDPIDICAIFGNLLDNAIEAAERVENAEDRFVEIKTGEFADKTAVRLVNSYNTEELVLEGGRPVGTSKNDKKKHGIGVSSVIHSLKKYGGMITYQIIPGNMFLTTVLFPKKTGVK